MAAEKSFVLFFKLVKLVDEIIVEAAHMGKIHRMKIPYDRLTFKNFAYTRGITSYSLSHDIDYKEGHYRDLIDLNPQIKSLDNYQDAVTAISKIGKVDKSQAEYWLMQLVEAIADQSSAPNKEDSLMTLTFRFIRELEGSPFTWTPEVWLQGVWMEDDTIEVNNGVTFKKPTPFDIQKASSLLDPFGLNLHPPSTIVLLATKSSGQPDVLYKIERMLQTLRLFRVGSVTRQRTFWQSESILKLKGGIEAPIVQLAPSYAYPLSKADTLILKHFIDRIGELIPEAIIRTDSLPDSVTDYIVIAIQRYNDAILKPEIIESKVSFAIMSLEAMYLKDKERQELDHRLAQRVAKVLGISHHQPIEVYNEMRRAYGIRSIFVHGSPTSKEEFSKMSNLAEKILEYTRLSIVISLQLMNKIDKDRFLNIVDNSLLSNEVSVKLCDILKENCLFI